MSRRLNIQVIGAGGMGSALAYLIGEVGHSVEVIDQNPATISTPIWRNSSFQKPYPSGRPRTAIHSQRADTTSLSWQCLETA
jgi:3-hydroxyacyl-CoA dehydrogenase